MRKNKSNIILTENGLWSSSITSYVFWRVEPLLLYHLFQGHVAVGLPGSDGGGSEKSRENHKVCDYKAKIINLISYHSIIYPPPHCHPDRSKCLFFWNFSNFMLQVCVPVCPRPKHSEVWAEQGNGFGQE